MFSALSTFVSYIFFGIFYLVLLLFAVVLVIARRQDKRLRRKGQWVRAKTLACEDRSQRDQDGAVSPVFETTFQFESDGQPISLVHKSTDSYPVGHYVTGYYLKRTGLFKPEHTMTADQGPKYFIMWGVILAFFLIITLQIEGIFPPFINEHRLKITALFACGIFIVVGLALCLHGLRELLNPRIRHLEGTVIDVVKKADNTGEASGRLFYYAVYTYWVEGQQQNQMSAAGSARPPEVGSRLGLTRNLKTGAVYPTQDLHAIRRMGVFLTLFASLLFAVVWFMPL